MTLRSLRDVKSDSDIFLMFFLPCDVGAINTFMSFLFCGSGRHTCVCVCLILHTPVHSSYSFCLCCCCCWGERERGRADKKENEKLSHTGRYETLGAPLAPQSQLPGSDGCLLSAVWCPIIHSLQLCLSGPALPDTGASRGCRRCSCHRCLVLYWSCICNCRMFDYGCCHDWFC